MQNYFYEGIIDGNINVRETICTNEKSSIIPPEFVELSQGRSISFLKERIKTLKDKIEKEKENIEINISKTKQQIGNINSLSILEKSIKKTGFQTEKFGETQTPQTNSENSQEKLNSLQKDKKNFVEALLILESKKSRLDEVESKLVSITQKNQKILSME